jgi:1-aminocyclopropane-1-carboxylate deaminase
VLKVRQAILVPKDMVDPEDKEAYDNYGNVQINKILGAETVGVGTSMEDAMQIARDRGLKPYLVPSGASQHPLGGLGYTRLMCQVEQWEAGEGVHFDTIVDVAGGGSTLAGLVAGTKLMAKASQQEARPSRELIGVGIFAHPVDQTTKTVLGIARTAAEKVGLDTTAITENDFYITDHYHAGAYGRLDERTSEAVETVARTEGVLLDPVYTGKAMAGLIDMVRKGELRQNQNVLFMHTGGQAALSAYPQLQ